MSNEANKANRSHKSIGLRSQAPIDHNTLVLHAVLRAAPLITTKAIIDIELISPLIAVNMQILHAVLHAAHIKATKTLKNI